MERFTRRAPTDWCVPPTEESLAIGNFHVKTIANPRLIKYVANPHFMLYFDTKFAVNSNGNHVPYWKNEPILADKIVVNHYITKSKEEYEKKKILRGAADIASNPYSIKTFELYDHNEVFDDGILKYRAARQKKFPFKHDDKKIARVIDAIVKTLTQESFQDAPADFFVGKLETFLTCRAITEKFQIKLGEHFAEEFALVWIYNTLIKADPIERSEIQMFMRALPEILSRPLPICKKINQLIQANVIPRFCDILKSTDNWIIRSDFLYVQKLLRLIK